MQGHSFFPIGPIEDYTDIEGPNDIRCAILRRKPPIVVICEPPPQRLKPPENRQWWWRGESSAGSLSIQAVQPLQYLAHDAQGGAANFRAVLLNAFLVREVLGHLSFLLPF